MKHAKCYKRNYPRPQFVRESFIDLNGEWDFEFDRENKGEREKWFLRKSLNDKIIVPFSYHTKASGINTEIRCDNIWYLRKLPYTRVADSRLILNFEGADYVTKVWVNGLFAGQNKGGYVRFSFDITDMLKDGENIITAKCEDSICRARPRGKQRWTDKNVTCWYTETDGLWKPVWAEEVNCQSIGNIFQEVLFERFSVRFEYEINDFSQGLSLQIEAEYEGRQILSNELSLYSSRGEITLNFSADHLCLPVKFWSPVMPNIYDLTYTLKKNGVAVDNVKSYTAFKRCAAEGNNISLNYWSNCYFKMILDQGYWPDGGLTPPNGEADIIKDVELIKQMGFNGVRKHQKIEDERFYYYCDVYGLFVWVEMPAVFGYTNESVENMTAEWTRVVKQLKNHPSIMAYVPINESWGAFNIMERGDQQNFASALYHLTKALDPHRFAISNDGWEHTESDLVTLHQYVSGGNGIKDAYKLEEFLRGERTSDRHTRQPFARGYKYGGQPVLLSEFAGIAFSRDAQNGNWGYGKNADNGAEFYDRLKDLIDTVKIIDGVSGYCVTQLTDVMQEKNGLLNEDRTPKIPIEKYREINED